MNFSDIAVCVNDTETRADAILVASELANAFDARLTAYYVQLDEAEILRWSGPESLAITRHFLNSQNDDEDKAKAIFDGVVNAADCRSRWRKIYHSEEPFRQLLCSDLIVIEQPRERHARYYSDEEFISRMILSTRLPVLVVPEGWSPKKTGLRVLIGWNESAPAMAAVQGAVPLLARAESVHILSIWLPSKPAHKGQNHPDLAGYLENKGINSRMHQCSIKEEHVSAESLLLEFAAEQQCDLIVIGGYGHSRYREIILGGVTRYLLKNSPLPVLLAH